MTQPRDIEHSKEPKMTDKASIDRIKELLTVWAGWHMDSVGTGYPRQSAFATERVQTSNRSTESYREMPTEVSSVNDQIERLAPGFRRVVALEYCDRRPAKTKAALLGIPREVFYARLRFIHEQLAFAMWG